PGAERRRQVHHHPRPAGPAAGDVRPRRGARDGSVVPGGADPPSSRLRPRGHEPLANLTGGEAIDVLTRGERGAAHTRRREELIERFELDPTKRARTYSKGNRQK